MDTEPKRRPIWVKPELLRRVERAKIIPEEPAWKVIARLLDEHELHVGAAPLPARGPRGKPA